MGRFAYNTLTLLILTLLPAIFPPEVAAGLRDIKPRPQQMGSLSGEPVIFQGTPMLVIPDNPTDDEAAVRDEALRLFGLRLGRLPDVVAWSEYSGQGPAIWLGTASRFPACATALDSSNIGGLGVFDHNEEYQLLVQDRRILLCARDHRGLRWGLQSLMQLVRDVMGQTHVDRVYIRDWPDLKKRIATVNTPVRTDNQYLDATNYTDWAYNVKMNEIEWNNEDSGNRVWTQWGRDHCIMLRNRIKNYGMTLTMSSDETAYEVDNKCWQEAVPVEGTLMRVTSSGFQIIPSSYGTVITNGGFESWTGNQPNGWTMRNSERWPWVYRDAAIRHSGTASVKFTNFSSTPCDEDLRQVIPIGRHRAYKIKFWYKLSGYVGSIRLFDQGTDIPYNRTNSAYMDFEQATTQDWRSEEVTFCSFHLDSVRLFIGPLCPRAGTLWLDDISIEAIAPYDIVRRTDTPVTVAKYRTNALMTEGMDYSITDTSGTSYDRFVRAPRFNRVSSGRLAIGDTVKVNWGWAFLYQGGRETNCFSLIEPLVTYQDRIAALDSMFHPDGFKIHINEVSYANHDQTCTSRGMSPGQLVGSYCGQMYQIIQARRPGAPVRIYGDAVDIFVFDPRAMPVTTRSWTVGMIEQLPTPVEVMAMQAYSSNIDSSLWYMSQYNHPSVLAMHLRYNSEQTIDCFKLTQRYPQCNGVEFYHWGPNNSDTQRRTQQFGELAWNMGPFISHNPLEYTYRPDSVVVTAEAWCDPYDGSPLPLISSVNLRYRYLPGGGWQTAAMTRRGTDLYGCALGSFDESVTAMEYYISATDSRDLASLAPADAEIHTFIVDIPIQGGSSGGIGGDEIQFSHQSILGGLLLEWAPQAMAGWYEVHNGRADFRRLSRTLIARQNVDCPRYFIPEEREPMYPLDSLHVYTFNRYAERR